jgi:hypothetical protein
VHLPDGATATEFRVYYYDNTPGPDLDVEAYLFSRGNYDTYSVTMASVSTSTSGISSSIQTSYDDTITSATIDNINTQYSIRVTLDASLLSSYLRFYGCKVKYTIDTLNP